MTAVELVERMHAYAACVVAHEAANHECGVCHMQSDDEHEMVAHILDKHPNHVVLHDGPTGVTVTTRTPDIEQAVAA